MPQRLTGYLLIAATIALTAYGQLILKWRMAQQGPLPSDFLGSLRVLLRLLFDVAVLSSFFAAFLASLAWMAALTRFELSYAYPFMSLSFVVVLLFGAWWLGESLTAMRVAGVALIVIGTALASVRPS